MEYIIYVAEGLAFLWFVIMASFLFSQHKWSLTVLPAKRDDVGRAIQNSARLAIPFGYSIVFGFTLYQVIQLH